MTMPGELLHMMESLERENEQLRAQMALMIAALQPCASGEEWKETTALINSSYSPVAFARQVCTELLDEFSTAPTVLYRASGTILHHSLGVPTDDWDGTSTLIKGTGCCFDGHVGVDGEETDIIVLECSVNHASGPKSEQGYKRARGIIPWKEGDELPEDTIARLRGRESEQE